LRLAGWSEAGETGGMKPPPDPHYRHRFSAEIISRLRKNPLPEPVSI
jgi:hypothetical protein